MNVSAIIVTRGDVDLRPVLSTIPDEWEKVIWNNGEGRAPGAHVKVFYATRTGDGPWDRIESAQNLSVYGRYAAIEYASHDLIYVQDDDVIVSDPEEIVGMRCKARGTFLVANMPQEFRHDGYTDSCLVGFGACFHRDAPVRAFDRYAKMQGARMGYCPPHPGGWGMTTLPNPTQDPVFLRTCDVVFTTLTPRVLVDVPKTNMPYAEDPSRMYRQPDHVAERTQVLEMARKVRDA